jgi:uncharacterized protein (UPF0332 family)
MALPNHTDRDGRGVGLTERPVLTNAGDALAKAERFAELSEQAADDRLETVIHGAYFPMFHAARAALLAIEGRASIDHAGVGASFAQMAARHSLRIPRSMLAKARDLHALAHHRTEDLTAQGRVLRAQVRPFLALCAGLVAQRAPN